ncbi:hypothetical protein C8T65DRAFT_626924 [Cerioporus squamosus]|nr:hypothetical protein C8T65DRAFT_626924 [Cerioporus squamosus]
MDSSLQRSRRKPGLGMGTEAIGGPGHVLGRKNIRAARLPQPWHISAVTRPPAGRHWPGARTDISDDLRDILTGSVRRPRRRQQTAADTSQSC